VLSVRGKAWLVDASFYRGAARQNSVALPPLQLALTGVLLLPAARSRRRDWHAAEQDRLPARHNGESLEDRVQAFVNMTSNVRFICAAFCFAMP